MRYYLAADDLRPADLPDLPAPLTVLSPWLDMKLRLREDVLALLRDQRHRRFIKTHTPLDELPAAEGVTYLVMGRDPRDVALSMDNHRANVNRNSFRRWQVFTDAS